MGRPGNARDSALWRTPAATRGLRVAPDVHSPGNHPNEPRTLAIRRVQLLFWGNIWKEMVERREQIATAFRAALLDGAIHAEPHVEPIPLVTTSVISAAAHTSPGDPPELLANADVTALVANLMSKRALTPWAGTGETLYCVVLCAETTRVDERGWFAYTPYRQNMRDIHCGWLLAQDDPVVVAERARKLLDEVESALLADAV